MKQPELGKKLAELRKVKGFTQEELVEKCNINVRTIQRIETGEVTPRPSTLRLILDVLGYDFTSLNEDDQQHEFKSTYEFMSWNWFKQFLLIDFDSTTNRRFSASLLQIAWIAGLINFLIGFPISGLEYTRFYKWLNPDLYILYTILKIASFLAFVYAQRGFIILGDFYKNYLMKISAYFIIFHNLFNEAYDIISLYYPYFRNQYADGGIALTIGAILIVYGISFQRIGKETGKAANAAGIFAIIAGAFFLTLILWFIGIIVLIPLNILEIVVLYKGYMLLNKTE